MAKIRQRHPQHQQLELRVLSDVKSTSSAARPDRSLQPDGRASRTHSSVEASEKEQSIYLAITAKYFESSD